VDAGSSEHNANILIEQKLTGYRRVKLTVELHIGMCSRFEATRLDSSTLGSKPSKSLVTNWELLFQRRVPWNPRNPP